MNASTMSKATDRSSRYAGNQTDAIETDAVHDVMAWWHERTGETISKEEARAMITDMVGFITTLFEWDSAIGTGNERTNL